MFLKMTLLSILMIPTISQADANLQRLIIRMMGDSYFVGCIEHSKQVKQFNAPNIAFCKKGAAAFMEDMSRAVPPAKENEGTGEDEDTNVASIRKFTL